MTTSRNRLVHASCWPECERHYGTKPSHSASDVIAFDDVVVNFSSMELFRAGKSVPVTPQEFRMLRFFVNNQGRVISDSELLNEVWDNRSHPTHGT